MVLSTISRRAGGVSRLLRAVALPSSAASLHATAEAGGAASQPHPKPVPLSKLKDSFLDGTSSTYLEELEERYRHNPASVDKTWASFFKSLGEARVEVSRGLGSMLS
jgi:hypothetical protein